jgi:hypothetical protein
MDSELGGRQEASALPVAITCEEFGEEGGVRVDREGEGMIQGRPATVAPYRRDRWHRCIEGRAWMQCSRERVRRRSRGRQAAEDARMTPSHRVLRRCPRSRRDRLPLLDGSPLRVPPTARLRHTGGRRGAGGTEPREPNRTRRRKATVRPSFVNKIVGRIESSLDQDAPNGVCVASPFAALGPALNLWFSYPFDFRASSSRRAARWSGPPRSRWNGAIHPPCKFPDGAAEQQRI